MRHSSKQARRERRRFAGAEAIGPGFYGLVVDNLSGVHIGQSLARQPVAHFLLLDPSVQRFLDDPAARTSKPLGQPADFSANADGTWAVSTSVSVAVMTAPFQSL